MGIDFVPRIKITPHLPPKPEVVVSKDDKHKDDKHKDDKHKDDKKDDKKDAKVRGRGRSNTTKSGIYI